MSRTWKKSLVVALTVSVASGLAIVFRLENRWNLIPFAVAVLISAWYGGLYPGLAATVSGFLVADYLLVEPTLSLGAESAADWAFLALFVGIGAVTSVLLEELRRKNEVLEELVQKLDQSNRDLERFSYTVAHDLTSPLRTIRTMTELFLHKNENSLNPESRRLLDLVVKNAQRMHDLIGQILELAKTNQTEVEIGEVDTQSVVETALEFLQDPIRESDATIAVKPLPVVRANQALLLRVFLNLIGNAVKYRSQEPLTIQVSASSNGKEHIFAVRDNGIGIDPQYQGQVFQVFRRLNGKGEGSGLGLATCKQIVERLDGRIWLESEAGKGSTFYFSLPK